MADPVAQAKVQNWTKFAGMIIGLAASVALGAGVFMWVMKPNYTALYSGMEARDASEVVAALQGAGIPYELDSATGIVKVEPDRVHEARLKLAEQGLPRGTGIGIEMLQQEQGFGTSQFIENARYHHAMETELARTIGTMRNVKSARVHLAIPKRSVFVRDQDKATASVALTLYGGRTIEQGQVDAIVHLVASSIPNLAPEMVTVVDQSGRLLSSSDNTNMAMTAKQYEYTKTVEEDFASRIERLIESILGPGRVRATVKAEVDFSEEESTEELFNPERQPDTQQIVRSEQLSEKTSTEATVAGVPGALSNQPPQGGQLQPGPGAVAGQTTAAANTPSNTTRNTVRNYEVDRTIRHKRLDVGIIKRLSVAVLLDDRVSVAKNGKETRTPLTQDEITRITTLVQQTIGFDEQRGDKVNVINASFSPAEAEEALPEPSFLDQPWVHNLGKQLLAGIIILILIFTIIRPTLRNISSFTLQVALPAGAGEEGVAGMGGVAGAGGQARLEHRGGGPIPLPQDHDQKVEFAKAMVDQDARRVANVVKEWVGNEA